MRPLMFLDIDGVLALHEESGARGFAILGWFNRKKPEPAEEIWGQLFDAAAVANLRSLHDEFQPLYVISSSWRQFFEREQMQEILTRTGLGVVAEHLHDTWRTVGHLRQEERVRAISHWLGHYKYPGPVLILDDLESGFALPAFVAAHPPEARLALVRCDPQRGFDFEKLQEAREALIRTART